MKNTFTVSALALAKALEQVTPVVAQNPMVPATACVLLVGRGTPAAGGAQLHLLCTNLETRLTTVLDIECAENFAICIEAKLLLTTVKGFPDAPLHGRVDGHVLHLRCGRSNYQLVGEDPAGFPQVKKAAAGARTLRIPSYLLHEALSAALAVANTVTNVASAFTNAVLVETTNQYAAFVGTSGTRLAAYTFDSDDDRSGGAIHWGTEYIHHLIPKGAADYLKRAISAKSPADVELIFDADTCRTADNRWYTRLMDVEFPEYRRVFPPTFTSTLTVEHGEIMGALRRLAAYTDHGDSVALHVAQDGTCVLRADNPMTGHHGEEVLTGDLIGEGLSIGFPAGQLVSILGLWDGGRVQLGLNGPQRGVILTQDADSADTGLACMIAPTAVVRPLEEV